MPRYHVQRSITINASPDKVFEAVSDYGSWTTWSPWLCAEPDAKVEVSADPSAVGSIYSWEGEIVGQGEIEHVKLVPGRRIEDEIRFLKPFRSKSQVAFDFENDGSGTKITWHMDGSLPWFLFWMVSQMEAFIGMDYQRGLKMLKEWLETGQVLSATKVAGVRSVGPLHMAGVRQTCSLADIGPTMQSSLPKAKDLFKSNDIASDGEMISVYHKFDLKAQTFDFTCGFVLPAGLESVPQGLSTWSLPSVKALCVEHTGSYENLGNAWSAANQYARYKKLKQSMVGAFELYKNSPQDTQAGDLLTQIYLPLK